MLEHLYQLTDTFLGSGSTHSSSLLGRARMRLHFAQMPKPLLHLITIFLATNTFHTPASATPFPASFQGLSFNQLFGRGSCANPCGWEGQLCCGADQTCYTDANNQAQCSSTAGTAVTTAVAAAGGAGYWQMYTTTYVETDLITTTKVVSSWCASTAAVVTTAAAGSGASCDYAQNESPCGDICCASGQYCVTSGQCAAAANGGSSAYYSSYMTDGSGSTISTVAFSAPLRPTSSTLVVVTQTASPTTTVPFSAPVETGANITLTQTSAAHSGLSGGAIAGIVIGVLLAIALLLCICFYLCVKGLLDGLLGFFGLGKKRKRRVRETEYIEEYHHHSSRDDRRGDRTWYGSSGRPARVERRTEKKKSGGVLGNLLPIGAGLGGLAAVLGMKRKRDDRRRRDEKSDYTSSYGSSEYYTSESSASSDDRRTRNTRHSSRSRTRR